MAGSLPGVADIWLAERFAALLAEKYRPHAVPGVRRISADIAAVNDGRTISHGHIHNILTGEADNLTDRTRGLLARFFGKPVSCLSKPLVVDVAYADRVQRLAARLASFDPDQIMAIEEAVRLVSAPEQSL